MASAAATFNARDLTVTLTVRGRPRLTADPCAPLSRPYRPRLGSCQL